MRKLSRSDLETISLRVLRAYWRLDGAKETPWYVDPDMLLTDLLGLKIDYRQLSYDGLTLGMTSFYPVEIVLPGSQEGETFFLDGRTVLLEEALQGDQASFGRRNFTAAHEAAHHILNLLFPGEYNGGEKARSVYKYRITERRPSRDWEEWQMDVLASCLLMPASTIRENMRIADLPEKIDYLNPRWRRSEYEKFCFLCDLMGVSKQALSYRMQRLGLLGEDQRRSPNDLLDVWRYED